jgi:hypothetical protein
MVTKCRSDEPEKQTTYIDHWPPDVLGTGATASFPGDAQLQGDRRPLAQQRTSQYLPELDPTVGNPLRKWFVALVKLL